MNYIERALLQIHFDPLYAINLAHQDYALRLSLDLLCVLHTLAGKWTGPQLTVFLLCWDVPITYVHLSKSLAAIRPFAMPFSFS